MRLSFQIFKLGLIEMLGLIPQILSPPSNIQSASLPRIKTNFLDLNNRDLVNSSFSDLN